MLNTSSTKEPSCADQLLHSVATIQTSEDLGFKMRVLEVGLTARLTGLGLSFGKMLTATGRGDAQAVRKRIPISLLTPFSESPKTLTTPNPLPLNP